MCAGRGCLGGRLLPSPCLGSGYTSPTLRGEAAAGEGGEGDAEGDDGKR